jgi:ribosome maturation factor RimP
MREDSRRGAPRAPGRAPGRAGQGRDGRAPRPGSRGVVGGTQAGGSAGLNAGASGANGERGTPVAKKPTVTPRLTSLIESVLTAMEIDLEAVKITSAGRRVVLRIVIDADGGVSLDDIADVSREVSAKLDANNAMGEAPYTLEVTSPGVDRPLTQPRHWRRAAGRLVVVPLIAEDQDLERPAGAGPLHYRGRVIEVDQDRVTLEIDGARRTFSLGELGPGRVQVEFGRLDETDDADDSSEEEPDGH